MDFDLINFNESPTDDAVLLNLEDDFEMEVPESTKVLVNELEELLREPMPTSNQMDSSAMMPTVVPTATVPTATVSTASVSLAKISSTDQISTAKISTANEFTDQISTAKISAANE